MKIDKNQQVSDLTSVVGAAMTILWDHNPGALETYAFALGSGVEQIQAGARISRALGEDASHTLVVIGPDIPLESACEPRGAGESRPPRASV